MDISGITMQVLSVAGAGADLLPADEGPALARLYNDAMATHIAIHPGRFAAFAHLPMTNPDAAADELDRTVRTLGFKGALINGLTQGQFLDHPRFAPLLQRAELLKVPVYLHPGLPPKAVADAYYSGLPKYAGDALAISGWGWHSETAIHVLRLIISGTLDKYPKLKLVIGHMGEMLPMMMARCDDKFRINNVGVHQRSVSQTLKEQVYITTSGVFTLPPLRVALETFGIDNVLFSVDYPFSTNEDGKRFLDSLPLSSDEIQKIVCLNAEGLLNIQPGIA
jgi:predicted TIM-barrel fold metal-dependent hydrolase